jgi:hypothetical protein
MKKILVFSLFFIGWRSYAQQDVQTLILKRSSIENFLKPLKGSRVFKPEDKRKRSYAFPEKYLSKLPDEIIDRILQLANIARLRENFCEDWDTHRHLLSYLNHELVSAKPAITQQVLMMLFFKIKIPEDSWDFIRDFFS